MAELGCSDAPMLHSMVPGAVSFFAGPHQCPSDNDFWNLGGSGAVARSSGTHDALTTVLSVV